MTGARRQRSTMGVGSQPEVAGNGLGRKPRVWHTQRRGSNFAKILPKSIPKLFDSVSRLTARVCVYVMCVCMILFVFVFMFCFVRILSIFLFSHFMSDKLNNLIEKDLYLVLHFVVLLCISVFLYL